MILIGSKDILEVKLDDEVQTNQLSYYCTYIENGLVNNKYGYTYNTSNIKIIPASKNTITIDYILITNLDTAPANVSIQILSNDNRIVIFRKLIGPDENIQYDKGSGWIEVNSNVATDSMNEEVPTGDMDGMNDTFIIAHLPISDFRMYLNGLRLLEGVDFTMTGTTITMINIPFPGDIFLVDYNF